jgi:transcription elongation factor Elf1
MTTESEKFAFTNVRPLYRESNEIRADRQRAAPSVVGLSSADVTCKTCGHNWTARSYGEGRFESPLGQLLFTCPECGAEEGVRAGMVLKS